MPRILIPGNISSAALIAHLSQSGDDISVIFESEIDAFGLTSSKTDYGSLNSTILRQAFHHETISQYRKTKSEFLKADKPKLIAVLSGTNNQVRTLFGSNANGLLSRFLIVSGSGSFEWKDPRPTTEGVVIEKHFEHFSKEYHRMWQYLMDKEVEIKFSEGQWNKLNRFGEEMLPFCHHFIGETAASLAKRHGNMLTRIAGIFTMIRFYEREDNSAVVYCNDDDFDTALWMVKLSLKNSIELYKALPGEQAELKVANDRYELLKQLPGEFKKAGVKKIVEALSIPQRSFDRILHGFVKSGYLSLIRRGHYKKTEMAQVALMAYEAKND
jgi:hypothetical protein